MVSHPSLRAVRTSNKSDIDNYYDKLRKMTEKYLKTNLVIMGAFNALFNARLDGEEHIIGKYGNGKRRKMVEFLLQKNFTLNSMFREKPQAKSTWMSPDAKTRN